MGKVLNRSLGCIAALVALLVVADVLTHESKLELFGVKASDLVARQPVLSGIRQWFESFATMADMPRDERLRLILEENQWKNTLVMRFLPDSVVERIPHFWQAWLRCWVLCAAVYFGVGAVWSYYIYFCFGDKLFAPGNIPGLKDVVEQMKVSNWAMPLYSLLPAFAEWAAEQGYTMVFPRIENIGLPAYVLYFFIYMFSVEFGVYWMHRGLHDVKWAYRVLHWDHHKYNKEHTLSPFAGLAFNPLDGIMQAVAYVWTLFYCPTHFLTHELLLFATGVWTANIHDNIHGNVWPVMGAAYHTIHHTTYKHNYGHYFVFMDWLLDTLTTPEQYEADKAAAAGVKATVSVGGPSPKKLR
ncbi:hypothetical protein HYH03_012428 [Edaphochlamys debaryana]|uniref:Fatty acid hydroxylase domain-containing protein n=1 Tax=Edaphochlamys debaryana TaxID=47281 RepID=A0A835XRN7_9CHLO|nr:hypothetical protein HYH03_012428 [Edaphochlamys debaryana]|eukprot:KAG2488988.1 hypothetical protein HYH03_012428 [Edaphochlamys debaryana]